MSRAPSGFLRVLARFPRLFFMAVYVTCALTPLTEAHGDGRPNARAHVEAQGIDKHYAHDESTCAACIVLSFIGSGAPAQPAVFVVHMRLVALRIDAPSVLVSTGVSRTYPSRAPPAAA